MRIVIGNKTYYKPTNLSFNFKKLHKNLMKLFSQVCLWGLVFVMLCLMATLAWRCY